MDHAPKLSRWPSWKFYNNFPRVNNQFPDVYFSFAQIFSSSWSRLLARTSNSFLLPVGTRQKLQKNFFIPSGSVSFSNLFLQNARRSQSWSSQFQFVFWSSFRKLRVRSECSNLVSFLDFLHGLWLGSYNEAYFFIMTREACSIGKIPGRVFCILKKTSWCLTKTSSKWCFIFSLRIS